MNRSHRTTGQRRCHGGRLAALILLLAGCTDGRGPYEAYVACNEQIRQAADDDDELLGCFTDERREQILARHANHTPEIWREQLRDRRPADLTLFRSNAADDGNEADLFMYSGVGVYLARHTATMQRVGWRWKIADENTLSVSPGFNDDLAWPAAASLSFDGAIEWQGNDALTVQAPTLPRCFLQIRHVYDYAVVQMQADCEKLGMPGDYSTADILHPAATRPIHVQAPNGGRLDEVDDGSFTVESVDDGRFTASFEFAVSGLDGPYTVAGRFENIPLPVEE